jgi:hypothetical protein
MIDTADLAHAAEDVRKHLALRARAVNDGVLDNADVIAAVRNGRESHALTDTVLRTLLAERDALAAEAVELRAIRDSRVREVRAAHAAGWLDHAEFIAERNRSVGDARETAGQAYTATRIADWHKTEPEATHG